MWVGNTLRGRSKERDKDPRVWNREEYRRLEFESFSIFVDNLPEYREENYSTCSTGLGASMIYTFPEKWKNEEIYMFAFIRYMTKGGTSKAIAKMNHLRLRSKILFVGEAKYRRTSGPTKVEKGRQEDHAPGPSAKWPQGVRYDDESLLIGTEGRTKETLKTGHGIDETKVLEATVVQDKWNGYSEDL
ncbi:hypothetical protein AHAS_Ahas16G0269100 [Arachis hypogaea]